MTQQKPVIIIRAGIGGLFKGKALNYFECPQRGRYLELTGKGQAYKPQNDSQGAEQAPSSQIIV